MSTLSINKNLIFVTPIVMNPKVIFYIPNIIDYIRILLLGTSIFLKEKSFASLYALSVSLDYFDGLTARKFNQISILGGILDMIIDRVSTMVILSKIAVEQPKYSPWCIFYSMVDFMSHFVFFLASVYSGKHHKEMSDNIFLTLYYNQAFLYFVCFGSELCFVVSYLFKGKEKEGFRSVENVVLYYLRAIAGLKTFFHIVHLFVGICVMSTVNKTI